ncbi:MAG: hypothetical protein P4M12_00035 [Gammaproteobacteria bacterium]|nr:hypothetical protein [Gammaproteobacteria bacterium]
MPNLSLSVSLANDISNNRFDSLLQIEGIEPAFKDALEKQLATFDDSSDADFFAEGSAFHALKKLADVLSKTQTHITLKFIPESILIELLKLLKANTNPAFNNKLNDCTVIRTKDNGYVKIEEISLYIASDYEEDFDELDDLELINETNDINVDRNFSDDEEFGEGEEFDMDGRLVDSVSKLPLTRTHSTASTESLTASLCSPRSEGPTPCFGLSSVEDITELENELSRSTLLLKQADDELKKSTDNYEHKLDETTQIVRKLQVDLALHPVLDHVVRQRRLSNGEQINQAFYKKPSPKKHLFIGENKTQPTLFSPAKESLTHIINDRMPAFDAVKQAEYKTKKYQAEKGLFEQRILATSCPSTFWEKYKDPAVENKTHESLILSPKKLKS